MNARDVLRSFIPAPENSVLHAAFTGALDAYHDEVLRIAAARQWAYWVEREMKEIREHGSLDHETEISREAVQEIISVIDPNRVLIDMDAAGRPVGTEIIDPPDTPRLEDPPYAHRHGDMAKKPSADA